MDLLLDTHLILWTMYESQRLSDLAKRLMSAPENRLYFSAANLWEITIKRALGRTEFQVDPHEVRETLVINGYRELAITSDHAMAVGDLPDIHGDPFDRLLMAQAAVEGFLLLTADKKLSQYPGLIRRV